VTPLFPVSRIFTFQAAAKRSEFRQQLALDQRTIGLIVRRLVAGLRNGQRRYENVLDDSGDALDQSFFFGVQRAANQVLVEPFLGQLLSGVQTNDVYANAGQPDFPSVRQEEFLFLRPRRHAGPPLDVAAVRRLHRRHLLKHGRHCAESKIFLDAERYTSGTDKYDYFIFPKSKFIFALTQIQIETIIS